MIPQQVSQTFQPLVTVNDSNSGQRSYIRLPIAGSLDSKGLQVGNPGFAVTLHTSINLILCGVSVFLPHPIENQQKYSEIQINFELFLTLSGKPTTVCVFSLSTPVSGYIFDMYIEMK